MPSLKYNDCGIRVDDAEAFDIPAVRYVEEGYTVSDFGILCDAEHRIGPLPEDTDGYLKIPPALRMWSADEEYYLAITSVPIIPDLSQTSLEDNPYIDFFLNLWESFNQPPVPAGNALLTWDDQEYIQTSDICATIGYDEGFMRSPIPSIQFIVDTASVSINRVITNVNTIVTDIIQNIVDISITSKTPCIEVTRYGASGSSDFELDWDKCCINIDEYMDILGFDGISIPFPDCPGKGKKMHFISSPSGCTTTLAKLTKATLGNIPYSQIDPLACPPDASKDYALVMRSGSLGWMEITSCEEAEA